MAHPGRGRINTRRSFRSIPRRVSGRLLNRQEVDLVYVTDMHWRQVSYSESALVVNIQSESRTWILPVSQLEGFVPLTGYRIRTDDTEELWEILSAQHPSDEDYECVCVKMTEHDGIVP